MLFPVPVILQLNFRASPRPIRNTPSSSLPIWSSRDTKQSRRRVQVICNCPVRSIQSNRRTAPLTKKTTETEDDRGLSLTALRDRTLYPLH